MPPTFNQELFDFDKAGVVPDHTDEYPDTANLNPDLHHVEGLIPEDGDYIWLAINIDSPETAKSMLTAAISKQRSEGTNSLGIALVEPGFKGAYSAGENIYSPN